MLYGSSEEKSQALLDSFVQGPPVEACVPAGQFPAPLNRVWNATASQWRKVLLEMPLDGRSFDDRYGVGRRDQALAEVTKWCLEFRQQDQAFQVRNTCVFGFLAVFLLTMASLKESEVRRSGGDLAGMRAPVRGHPAARQTHECDQVCGTLIRDHAVQCALRALYQPAGGGNSAGGGSALASAEWKNLDFGSLTFHCHGTTSIILRGKAANSAHGTRDLFALKLVLYPFLRISTIEGSTRQYMSRYSQAAGQRSHIVRVWASTSRWILMDFIEGIALDDLLANDDLIAAKLPDPSRTFTEILADLIRSLPGGGAAQVGIADADLASTPVNELLRLYSAAAEANRKARKSEARSKVEFERMGILGSALFDALDDLESQGIIHEDLAPQNIIVANDAEWSFKLVDLGRNYLYTHSVTGSLSLEASYIAPEVKEGNLDTPKADLYSLGQILIELGGIRHNWDGRIPDEVYVRAPLLARFLVDLTDHDPDHRLGIFKPRSGSPVIYRDLRTSFREELDAADAAEKYELPWSTRPDPVSLIREMFQPLADAPGRQRRLWKIRRQQHLSKDPARGMHVTWLLFWSMVAAVAFTLTMTVVTMWLLRDLGWSWQDRLIEVIQKAKGTEQKDVLPWVDSLRAPGYVVPDWRANLPERMMGISYAMVAARYYEALLAGVSPAFSYRRRDSLGLKAVAAEFFMRLETVVAMGMVISVTLIDARWWLIASALGQSIAVACNWTVAQFAKSALHAGWRNGVTTIEHPDDVTGLREFLRWTPLNVCYSLSLWLLGGLLYYHIIHDTYVYAVLATFINLFLFYMIKCGLRAPEVRIALTKACFCAERLRLAQAR
jgi:serine/threonine protein kinase